MRGIARDRIEALKADILADPPLRERVNALSDAGFARWLEHVRRRLEAGEVLDGLGWRALVDVRRECPPPDGWLGDGFPWRPPA